MSDNKSRRVAWLKFDLKTLKEALGIPEDVDILALKMDVEDLIDGRCYVMAEHESLPNHWLVGSTIAIDRNTHTWDWVNGFEPILPDYLKRPPPGED